MLLKELKLWNIRSYPDETLELFPGSSLLAGDIGSGKSTLLLAIEFALFGISRPDLPGEALLRKGSQEGSVELKFQVQNKDYLIKRSLKKDKDSIKQTSGHFIANNLKKELTPIELKAEIISLLGYPEEVLTKNKNYLYRYTVYCPQEEMKLILQEEAELRLDVLRKIFNLDKYKIIRENLGHYLKQLRTKMAVLEAKVQPLEEQKKRLKKLSLEQEQLGKSLVEIIPDLEKVHSQKRTEKDSLERLESRQKKFQELKNQHQTVLELLQEKALGHQQLLAKKDSLQKQFSELAVREGISTEQVKMEIKEIELSKSRYLARKASLEERTRQLSLVIQESGQEIAGLKSQIFRIAELETKKNRLAEEISQKGKLKHFLEQSETRKQGLLELLAQKKTFLSQAKELKDKFDRLDNCPICFQAVPKEHKSRIIREEEEKISLLEEELNNLNHQMEEVWQTIAGLKEKIEELNAKENLLARVAQELGQLAEKKERLQKKEPLLESWKNEETVLARELAVLAGETRLDFWNQNLVQLQDQLNLLSKKQYLAKYLQEINLEIQDAETGLKNLSGQKEKLESELSLEKEDLSSRIMEKKSQLDRILQQEKDLSVRMAQLKTQLGSLQKQSQELEEQVELLVQERSRLLKIKEIYHWLEEYLLNLTYTLEKLMMVNIHRLFNQLFQEWFSILMDDENISAKIDDSFTPIIEQNGYEISFINLSGGEKTSCALAYRLALNKVINDIVHEIKTKDLLILDEPTDGFSSEQLDKVREVLDKLGLGQVIIVSHEAKIETFVENVVRVRKEGNVSRVG